MNHLLRVTAATRLFQQSVDEQLIMSRTGHRSIDGVRTYKRVSESQQLALSNVLNRAAPAPKKFKPSAEGLENSTPDAPSCSNPPPHTTSESIPVQPTPTINGGVLEGVAGGGIHINGCQIITVNYYMGRKD